MIISAPAKLNLFLHIINRRDNGYHNIQTVFQFLNYCDELQFHLRNDGQINLIVQDSKIVIENNLITRAALLLQQISQTKLGADIILKKNIPIGAGLGGGSSDAATTLVALNQLWQTQLPQQRLAILGAKLGADVPVFMYGKAAWAEGIGDQLQPIVLPEPWYLVLVPNCHVSTAEIYAAQELTRNTSPITINEFLSRGGHNDFEPVVRRRYPEVGAALDWLAQFAPTKMTGTGNCVFAAFANEKQALAVAAKVPKNFQNFVAKGLNHSPLLKVITGV